MGDKASAASDQAPNAAAEPQASTTNATNESAKPDQPADRRGRLREAGKRALGLAPPPPEPQGAPPSVASGEMPTQKAEALADKIEEAGGKTPEQKPGESSKDLELRLSQTLMDLQRAQKDGLGHKQRADAAEKKAAELEALIKRAKDDPAAGLELMGRSFDDLADLAIKGKLTKKQYAELPPEVQAKIERYEAAEKAEREKKEAAEKAERERQETQERWDADLKVVEGSWDALVEAGPLLESVPDGQARLLNAIYAEHERTGEVPSLTDVAKRMHEVVATELEALLTPKNVALLKPEIRDTLLKALQAAPTQTTSTPPSEPAEHSDTDGPSSLTAAALSEVPTRKPDKPLTREERKARKLAAGKAVLASF